MTEPVEPVESVEPAAAEVTRLILWRHGRTSWNASDRIQGHLDIELSEFGLRQAELAAVTLAALGPAVLVSSDLRRALATAAVLGDLTGLPVRVDPHLRERGFGDWQGLTTAEVRQRFPAEYARWRTGHPVNGCRVEELDDFGKRAGAALSEAADLAPGRTVVVACHGGTAKYGMAAMLGWPVEVLRGLGPLENCRWVELRDDGVIGWRLYGYNLS